MGHNLITIGTITLVGSKFTGKVVELAGKVPGVSNIGKFFGIDPAKVVGPAADFSFFVGSVMLAAGMLLAYVLPILPGVFWIFGVVAWVVLVFEAVVAAPLWGLAHIRLDGEGIAGPAGQTGYELFFNIAVRPALMVIGFFVALVIFQFGNALVIAMFLPAMKFTAAGHSALIGAAVWSLMAACTSIGIGFVCFCFTTSIADNVPRWLGMGAAHGGIDPVNEGRTAMAAMGYGAMRSGMQQFKGMQNGAVGRREEGTGHADHQSRGAGQEGGKFANVPGAIARYTGSPSDQPIDVGKNSGSERV
jgi:hypothetical protein